MTIPTNGPTLGRSQNSTRAPFWVFSDPKIYEEEQEKIFRGKVWNFLCLEG